MRGGEAEGQPVEGLAGPEVLGLQVRPLEPGERGPLKRGRHGRSATKARGEGGREVDGRRESRVVRARARALALPS